MTIKQYCTLIVTVIITISDDATRLLLLLVNYIPIFGFCSCQMQRDCLNPAQTLLPQQIYTDRIQNITETRQERWSENYFLNSETVKC